MSSMREQLQLYWTSIQELEKSVENLAESLSGKNNPVIADRVANYKRLIGVQKSMMLDLNSEYNSGVIIDVEKFKRTTREVNGINKMIRQDAGEFASKAVIRKDDLN